MEKILTKYRHNFMASSKVENTGSDISEVVGDFYDGVFEYNPCFFYLIQVSAIDI